MRVDHKKKSNGVRLYHKRMSNGKDDHKKKSDGVRVDNQKGQWGESSPLERVMR